MLELKICSGCGAVNLDERTACGICGRSIINAAVLRPGEAPPPPPVRKISRRQLEPMSGKRLAAILVTIVIGAALTIGGLSLETAPIGREYNLIGQQMAIFGIIIFMALILGATGGLFSGWRGWTLEWVRKKKEANPRMPPEERKKNAGG